MELLNHFVAARLMKDAQLFERIGRYDATPRLSKPVNSTPPATDPASKKPEGGSAESAQPARDDRRVVPPTESLHDSRNP